MWKNDEIKMIEMEITSLCNIACPDCSRAKMNNGVVLNKDHLDIDLVRERIPKGKFPNLKTIRFCGTIDEPTAHPRFFDFIDYVVNELDVGVQIATNGSLKTTEWWEKLAEKLGNREDRFVTWGIDGIDEMSEVYRVGSSFKKVQENFRAFNAAGGNSLWQFIVFKHNVEQEPLVDKIAADEGFIGVKKIYSFRETKDMGYERPEFETASTEIKCRYGNEGKFFINHKGDIVPCCFVNHFHMKRYDKYPVEEIYDGQDYIEMFERHGGTLATNMRYNQVEDVLQGDFFQSIKDAWNDTPIKRCSDRCKFNVMHKNEFVMFNEDTDNA